MLRHREPIRSFGKRSAGPDGIAMRRGDTMKVEDIARLRETHPDNLMARYFDRAYYEALPPEHQRRLELIIATGWQNPDSIMGAYAMHPDDYDLFRPYLDKLIRAYHHIDGEVSPVSDWDTGGTLDLRRIDAALDDVSMRVRVGRNLADFPLPGAMTRAERMALEGRMVEVFGHLVATDGFGGGYVSLTPGSPHEISSERYDDLVAQHRMFKDMSRDRFCPPPGSALTGRTGAACTSPRMGASSCGSGRRTTCG